MSFTFVHAADIHLDSPLRGLEQYPGAPVAEIRGATRQAFINLVTYCIDQQVAFLLLAGDIYDGDWKDYNTGLFFLSQLARLKEAGVPVYIVHGNHDADSQMKSSLRAMDNMHVFSSKRPESKELPQVNVVIHGQSYATRELTTDLSADFPKVIPGAFNIGLLHTSADGRFAEHAKYAPCSIQALIDKGYDYWALGHVHRRIELKLEPHIIFPGNLQGRHIRETGTKGATVVTVNDGRVTVQHRDFSVVRWELHEVTLETALSPSHAVDLVHQSLSVLRSRVNALPLAVRVRLSSATEAHAGLVSNPEKWINEIRARGTELGDIWVEKVLVDTRTPIDLDALRQRQDPLGELLRTIESFREDDALMTPLLSELKPLQDKLPAELLDGVDSLRFDGPEHLREMIDDVEQLLIPQLLESGETA